jgi:hypothetical protein
MLLIAFYLCRVIHRASQFKRFVVLGQNLFDGFVLMGVGALRAPTPIKTNLTEQ